MLGSQRGARMFRREPPCAELPRVAINLTGVSPAPRSRRIMGKTSSPPGLTRSRAERAAPKAWVNGPLR
jgi:hypothetical protein